MQGSVNAALTAYDEEALCFWIVDAHCGAQKEEPVSTLPSFWRLAFGASGAFKKPLSFQVTSHIGSDSHQ